MKCNYPRALAFLIAILIVANSSVRAAVMPALNVQVTADSGNWNGNPTGTNTSGDIYNYTGSHVHSGWTLDWNLSAEADPFINGNILVTNTTAGIQTFTTTITLPIAPAIGPTSLLGGSISGSMTSDGTPGMLSSAAPDAIYTALIDGSTVAATMLNNPTSINAVAFGSATLGPADFGTPIPSQVGPPVSTSIGIRLKFTLTPGDQASITSVFVATPEPGALSLCLLAAPLLLRRRAA